MVRIHTLPLQFPVLYQPTKLRICYNRNLGTYSVIISLSNYKISISFLYLIVEEVHNLWEIPYVLNENNINKKTTTITQLRLNPKVV